LKDEASGDIVQCVQYFLLGRSLSGMRLIFFVGKGGVGKTTAAASTGLLSAREGHRTAIVSLDLAHSLGDSFDVDRAACGLDEGQPVEVHENLWVQELNLQREMHTHWDDIYAYIADVLEMAGLDEIVAEEIAHLPGMAEAVGLFYVNKYYQEDSFDVVLLDCAPTGESLRFLSMPTALNWYMNKVFTVQRNSFAVTRPFASAFTDIPLPTDEYFETIKKIYEKLQGVGDLLEDEDVTSARLVTKPEKMVVRETQRAFMYLSLYGINVDLVVANGVYPENLQDGYLSGWKETQHKWLKQLNDSFAPVPVRNVELFGDQVVGQARLESFGEKVYEDEDPAGFFYSGSPCWFEKEDGRYWVSMKLPFADKEELDLRCSEDQLIVSVGDFKRHLTLPRSIAHLEPHGARMDGDTLHVEFGGDER